jgi:hypothetical protein
MPSAKEMTEGMLGALNKIKNPAPAPAPSESDESKAKLLGTGMANRTAQVIMKRKKQLDEVM